MDVSPAWVLEQMTDDSFDYALVFLCICVEGSR